MGLKTGRTGTFVKGQKAWNKGIPFSPKGSEKGRFKKGDIPHNANYLGHERVDPKDGYIYVSVDQPNKHTGFERSYVLKHRWLWEKENGLIPEGHVLKSIDGNRQNTDPSNWVCIPRSMLPFLVEGRAGFDYDNAPEELKPLILARAELRSKISEKAKA